MPQLYQDVLFCLIFAVILMVLAKHRNSVLNRDKAAYRRIVTGLFFLAGFSILQLTGNQGIFSGLAYLGDSAGRKVIEALAIVGGLVFLLSGIGAWLPSLTRNREDRRKLNKRYYCLKMINEALDRGKNLNEKYEGVRSCLLTYLGFSSCSVYKYSSRKDTLYLSNSDRYEKATGYFPERIKLSESELKDDLLRFRTTISSAPAMGATRQHNPDLIIPISYQNRLFGAYFCRAGRNIRIDDDLVDFMSVIGSLTGKQTYLHVADTRREYHRTQQTALERIGGICNQYTTVSDLVPQLFQNIRELAGADFLSVASLDNSGENMIRYTIGSGGRLLLEKGISRQTRGTDIYTVFESGQALINPDFRPDDRSGEQDGLFLSCGMRSRLTCPVKAGKKVVGVLTLGHSRPHYYSAFHLERVERICSLIGGIIQHEQLCRNLETREDHMLRLQLMQNQMLENPSAQSFFNDTCDLLTRRMKCTVARISLLDKDQKHLMSQACRSIREIGHDLRAEVPIPLSLLPWHRMTLDAKKLMLINQEDPESRMPPQESTSSLIPNIKSALLVPIMFEDRVKGIISIGEARNWNRRAFGATDLIFAKDLAAKCSLALRMKQLQMNIERSREESKRRDLNLGEFSSDLKFRIKSPLTSIIGAVELLRQKGVTDDFYTRYYDLILKSADRIKVMTDEDLVEKTEFEAIEPEQVIG